MSTDQRSYDEKRNFIRVLIDCEILLKCPSDGHRFTAKGKNLSAGGVLFCTRETLRAGDMLDLQIESGQSLISPLRATIEVVRVEVVENSADFAVGSAIREMQKN